MRKSFVVRTAATALGVVIMAGCSSQPTTADLMRSQADEAKSVAKARDTLADNWESGKALVASGEKEVVKGESLVDDGEDNIRKGQALIDKGNKQVKKGKARVSNGNQQVAKGRQMVDKSLVSYRQSFPKQSLTPAKK